MSPILSGGHYARSWHYCIHCDCKTRTSNLFQMKQHLRAFHGLIGPYAAGEDYVDDAGFADIKSQKERIHEVLADRFSRALDSLLGADDFVLDCGTEAPPDWLPGAAPEDSDG